MRFCNSCGASLETLEGAEASSVSCPSCGGETPAGFSFCQQCGTPLEKQKVKAEVAAAPKPIQSPQSPQSPQSAQSAQSPAPAKPKAIVPSDPDLIRDTPTIVTPKDSEPESKEPVPFTPPAGMPPADLKPADIEKPEPALAVPQQVLEPAPAKQAPPPAKQAPPIEQDPAQQKTDPETLLSDSAQGNLTVGPGAGRTQAPEEEKQVLARLVSVKRDGTDGEAFELTEEAVDLGRTEGQLTFPEDPYLSDRHCRFAIQDKHWVVQDLTSCNGVFLKLKEVCEITDGDRILLGKQVFSFDWLNEAERNLCPAVEHGVMILGSPLLSPWGRLRQITVAGVARDVYHLFRTRITMGREDGDLIFPDDEFISRKHLALSFLNGRAEIKDLGSSNGTFIRIKDRSRIASGEMMRIGDQLLRFEIS